MIIFYFFDVRGMNAACQVPGLFFIVSLDTTFHKVGTRTLENVSFVSIQALKFENIFLSPSRSVAGTRSYWDSHLLGSRLLGRKEGLRKFN